MKEKAVILFLLLGILLFGNAFFERAEQEQVIYTAGNAGNIPVVVIDAGHGGKDPGKVGSNGALEKDINLSIAFRLKSLLEQNNIMVVMTREEDKDLASENSANRKNEDLRARAKLVEETSPVVMVSIHQNSYTSEEVDGAQVFYYSGSQEGKLLGTMVQAHLKQEIDRDNHRAAKANKEYYLLKNPQVLLLLWNVGFYPIWRKQPCLSQRNIRKSLHLPFILALWSISIP